MERLPTFGRDCWVGWHMSITTSFCHHFSSTDILQRTFSLKASPLLGQSEITVPTVIVTLSTKV